MTSVPISYQQLHMFESILYFPWFIPVVPIMWRGRLSKPFCAMGAFQRPCGRYLVGPLSTLSLSRLCYLQSAVIEYRQKHRGSSHVGARVQQNSSSPLNIVHVSTQSHNDPSGWVDRGVVAQPYASSTSTNSRYYLLLLLSVWTLGLAQPHEGHLKS